MDSFLTNQGFFHLGAKIFKNLDFKTQLTCRLVKKSWNQFLEYEESKSKIDFHTLLRMLEEPEVPKNDKEYDYLVKEINYQKWTKFLLKMEAKAENPWINGCLQKYIRYINSVGLSIFPLEYFVLTKNAKIIEFIFKEELFDVDNGTNTFPDSVHTRIAKWEFSKALKKAVENGYFEIMKYFKPYMSSNEIDRIYFDSTRKNDLKTLKILFPNPKEPLMVDSNGNNPIHIAAFKGYVEIVKYFIENTKGLTAQNHHGYTPLYKAASNSNIKIMSIILNAVSEDHILKPIKNGMNVIHLEAAYGYGRFETLKELCQRVTDPIVPDWNGYTPIHYAASNGHLEILKFLTTYNCDLKITNKQNKTPMQLAKLHHHTNAVKFLKELEKRQSEKNF